MSAPAIKSTMPGVGTNPPTTGHSMMPMNMMAQKVVQSTESSSMKPMSGGSNLSYVTLQPPNQPLSLVQDHRPPVYQAPPTYSTMNVEKEAESNVEKAPIPNGLELAKVEAEAPVVPTKPSETCKSNSSVAEACSVQEQPPQQQLPSQQSPQQQPQPTTPQTPQAATTPVEEAQPVVAQTPTTNVQSTVEEKKSPVNSSTKETEEQSKVPQTQKVEDSAPKVESPQKPKIQVQTLPVKPALENSSSQSTPPKVEVKASSNQSTREPKEFKRKPKESSESRVQGTFEPKRRRRRTEPFQSPLPEIAMIVKTLSKPSVSKATDDKLIVFYKNEFLAVRNTEGSFYVCQAMQNIYKSSRRIRIRWLSQDKTNGEIYSPDFYDLTDFDCILTNLDLNKIDKNKYQLTKLELLRTENILKRAIDVEAGVSEKPSVTEEHPDGLDLSLFKDEAQLKTKKGGSSKQKRHRKKVKRASTSESEDEESDEEESEKKSSVKGSSGKKRSADKALAIAKSVAKSSSRAERALNRGIKSSDSVNNLPTAAKAESKKMADGKKAEPKKATAKPPSNNASAVSRGKFRGGNAQATQESKSGSISRPKRGIVSAVTSSDDSTQRKKTRGKV